MAAGVLADLEAFLLLRPQLAVTTEWRSIDVADIPSSVLREEARSQNRPTAFTKKQFSQKSVFFKNQFSSKSVFFKSLSDFSSLLDFLVARE